LPQRALVTSSAAASIGERAGVVWLVLENEIPPSDQARAAG
jgi:hypothetical protein